MSTNIMQTNYESSDQGAQIIAIASRRENVAQVEPFIDNLDHLSALELEAKLMLAVASMRRCLQESGQDGDPWNKYRQYFPFLAADATLEQARSLLHSTAELNRSREESSLLQAVELNYQTFSHELDLQEFECKALLLLLMRFTAPSFADVFVNCEFEKNSSNGIEIGTLLSIICENLRDQLECRRFFSVDATLMKNEIFVIYGLNDTDNILNESVYLHERIARYIVGDNNLYNSTYKFIRREKSNVNLDQVIITDSLKKEITGTISRYIEGRDSKTMEILDDFYGYGTGMVFLFHGPSGTGKTMLAKGLASYCHRELISFCATDMREIHMGEEEIMAALFREAALHNAIVFLDECDDIFINNTRASRALLLEIEKARCVIILATNKPIDLDPAMERRLTMKVSFSLPDAELRYQMWQALMPNTVTLADDVDLALFADRYIFTGGLIKNSIFMAINAAMGNHSINNKPVITLEILEHAAGLQSLALSDINGICKIYTPTVKIDNLHLRIRQKEQIRNTAQAYQRLQAEGLGINVLVSSSDIQTGIKTVEAMAESCGLKIKEFDYAKVLSHADEFKVIDPVTQQKVTPINFAFSPGTGDASLILFVDYEEMMGYMLENKNELSKSSLLNELLAYLRNHQKFFCMVTGKRTQTKLPVEFNLSFDLEYPSEELQINCWEKHLGKGSVSDGELVSLVEHYPMHGAEIDFIARQATIQSIIQGKSGSPTLNGVKEVISIYREKNNQPILFGEGGWGKSDIQ